MNPLWKCDFCGICPGIFPSWGIGKRKIAWRGSVWTPSDLNLSIRGFSWVAQIEIKVENFPQKSPKIGFKNVLLNKIFQKRCGTNKRQIRPKRSAKRRKNARSKPKKTKVSTTFWKSTALKMKTKVKMWEWAKQKSGRQVSRSKPSTSTQTQSCAAFSARRR